MTLLICPQCQGTGSIRIFINGSSDADQCPNCDGQGSYSDDEDFDLAFSDLASGFPFDSEGGYFEPPHFNSDF
jgi:RecJ-like exonuclease